MKKFLIITIFFISFLYVFTASTCSHAQHVQDHIEHNKKSIEFKRLSFEYGGGSCQNRHLLKGVEDKRLRPVLFTKVDSFRQNFKFLKLVSLFKVSSSNFYSARSRPPDLNIAFNFQQKLKQANQLLAMVKIE